MNKRIRPILIRALPPAIVAVLITFVVLRPLPVAAEANGSPVRPLIPCNEYRVPPDTLCSTLDMFDLTNQQVLNAKTDAANAYTGSVWKLPSGKQLPGAEDLLTKLTGERLPVIREKDNSLISIELGMFGLKVQSRNLSSDFHVLEQLNPYYCGPATVASILDLHWTAIEAWHGIVW